LATAAANPTLLPLPASVLRHHGKALFRLLAQWRDQKRVPPVLLLTGSGGVGKRSLAYFISQWLLCEKAGPGAQAEESLFGPAEPPSGDPVPCGECGACLKALKGNWVDFTEISAETPDGEGSSATGALKIEQFRKLKATAGFGAFDGAYRITLIRDADRLTVQAANSILKLLEEPPPGWVLLLTASDPSLLLPTLVSRCQTLRLRPFAAEILVALLAEAGVPEERRAICARLAQGSWGKALALAADEAWERRASVFRFLEQPGAELNALVDWAAQEPAHFELLLDQLEQVTADLITWSLSPEKAEWRNSDGARALARHAEAATRRFGSAAAARGFWTARADRLFRARQERLAPLNKKLLAQDLLLPWLGA
jgi:DNA polymerase-3 subunit delta'